MGALYEDWNAKINLISRKDIANLYEKHILHALAMVNVMQFKAGAHILDLGTGGGLPGIPLAIFYPNTKFTLIDGTGKKIMVVQDIAEKLGLENVSALHCRAEDLKNQKFDFVVSRAVAELGQLLLWSNRLLSKQHKHVLPNGLLAYKGGNVRPELAALPKGEYYEIFPLRKYFPESYYEEKCIVYLQGS